MPVRDKVIADKGPSGTPGAVTGSPGVTVLPSVRPVSTGDRNTCVVCEGPVRRPGITPVCASTNCRRTLADRQAWEKEQERQRLRQRLNCPVRIAVTAGSGKAAKTRVQVVEDGRFSANEVIATLRRLLGDEAGDWFSVTIESMG